MSKRIESQFRQIKRSKEKVRFNLGTLSLLAFCTFLIIIATFSQLSFFHYYVPMDAIFHPVRFFSDSANHFISTKYYQYIPQIPVIFFVSTLLGSLFASIAVSIYVVLGLAYFPIFALGGGIGYVTQYNFGYILAYLPAVIIICKTLRKNYSYKSIAKATLLGVLTIHIIGILYSIVVALIKREPYEFILEWIVAQSTAKIIYDYIFSFIAILLARITRKILWIVMG